MDNILNKNEQESSDIVPPEIATNSVANETASHLRNLILNANITITTAQPQQKIHNPTDDTKPEKENSCQQVAVAGSCETTSTTAKRPKLSVDISERSMLLNPLASLPVSLISNGTLSVTSDSACVAIENGVPILKEASCTDKQPIVEKQTNISVTTLAPVSTKTNSENLKHAQLLKVNMSSKTNDLNSVKFSKDVLTRRTNTESSDNNKKPIINSQSSDVLSINNIILKALTDVPKLSPFGKTSLIPNPNQMDFLTLLGLEMVVDRCCADDVPKHTGPQFHQTPLLCGQCYTDFTTTWHFYKNPLRVLCERCFNYNEHQIFKAAQTLRLAKEYTKALQLKQKIIGKQYKFTDTINQSYSVKSECHLSTRVPTQQMQNQLFQDYINAAGIFTKGSDSVSDLARLGAAIASNPEIFEAAKVVNSLNSTATPLLRAKAVQNFQIALFKGLHAKLSPFNDIRMQDQTLLCYQMTIAQMVKQANVGALQPENQIVETPLAGIVRAIKAQHHSLIKTIMKQVPKSVDYGTGDDKKYEKENFE